MSTVCWVGVAVDPETQGVLEAQVLDEQITEALAAHPRYAHIIEPDGSERRRHRVSSLVVTDFYDRHGTRIGLGIEACSADDALKHEAYARTALSVLGIDHRTSIWVWDRAAVPSATPELVFG